MLNSCAYRNIKECRCRNCAKLCWSVAYPPLSHHLLMTHQRATQTVKVTKFDSESCSVTSEERRSNSSRVGRRSTNTASRRESVSHHAARSARPHGRTESRRKTLVQTCVPHPAKEEREARRLARTRTRLPWLVCWGTTVGFGRR